MENSSQLELVGQILPYERTISNKFKIFQILLNKTMKLNSLLKFAVNKILKAKMEQETEDQVYDL